MGTVGVTRPRTECIAYLSSVHVTTMTAIVIHLNIVDVVSNSVNQSINTPLTPLCLSNSYEKFKKHTHTQA